MRVPKGPRGAIASAGLIANLIREGARDFYVRQKAIEIFREAGARPKDRFGEVLSLFHWVRHNIRYTRDIFRVELLHTARRMLELQAGDCDDMTILLGAMLLATGHPVRIALTGFRPGNRMFTATFIPKLTSTENGLRSIRRWTGRSAGRRQRYGNGFVKSN